MATTGTKKKTAAKKKKTTGRVTKSQQNAKKQMWAVVLFALGLLLGALTFIRGGRLWLQIHNFLFGIFGWSVYFLAPLMIYIAIIAAMDKPLSSIKAKLWQMSLLIVIISGAIQIFGPGLPDEGNLVRNVVSLYEGGIALDGGGIAGAIFALPLMGLFEKTGASIIIVLFIFVFIMLLTGSTLISLFQYIRKPVEGLEEAYAAHVEDRQAAQEQKKDTGGKRIHAARFNIDVDIDADSEPVAPNPVKASKAEPPPDPEGPAPFPQTARDRLMNLAGDDPVEYISIDELRPESASVPQEASESEPVTAGVLHPLEEDILAAGSEQEEKEDSLDSIVERFAGASGSEAEPGGEPEMLPLFDAPPKSHEFTGAPAPWSPPPVSLLKQSQTPNAGDVQEELRANAQRLVDTLMSFGVQTRITDICRGPAVTRYELQPSAGVKIRKILGLADDIALNLASAGIRIEAPIPNKAAVGIEVPNKVVSVVNIRDLIESHDFRREESPLAVALGKDIAGKIILADIGKMPHVLIAGATGAGKSVCINSIIVSLLYRSSPEEVKLLMVDPKVVELGVYNAIPHLLVPVVTDPRKAAGALNWAVQEMLKRYQTFAEHGVRDLTGYNRLAGEREELQPMPRIVIIIDELADLMMAAPHEVEDSICRLAQMARAAGMHLVIATQRPSVDVITGVIKANIPSRIAFAVSSQVDSRTILDMGGAEKLLGRGDMLFYPVGAAKPVRVQGCFVTDTEVEQVVSHIKESVNADYDQSIAEQIDRHVVAEKSSKGGSRADESDEDEMLPQAIECVVEAGQASTSQLQRRLKLGYARAARIIDQLEERGIVGPFEGAKPRQVLISKDRWIEMKLSGAEDAQLSRADAAAGQPEPVDVL